MKKYKSIFKTLLLGSLLLSVGCQDDFTELNDKKDAVATADPKYIFAQGVLSFEPSDYTYWFFNAVNFYNATQYSVPTASVTENVIEGSEQQSYKSIEILKYVNALKYERSKMDAVKSAQYENVAAALDVLAVYMGIFDTDFCGDIPFTEAAAALYGGTYTPKYDHVEDLYTLWLGTLDKSITSFTTAANQIKLDNQDVIYKGNWAKWAKLANSLKLKIAARLISQNFELAKSIASQVVAAPCGVLDGTADDFLFHKADAHNSNNDYVYHWNNGVLAGAGASKSYVDFLIKNKDPRVRFFYKKNSWNSKIVDLFLAQNRKSDIPAYIMDNIETKIEDGKEVFSAWKGLGEPWVRYYGLPGAYNANANTAVYGDWFDYSNRCKIVSGTSNYVYVPFSTFQEEMLRGRIDFTVPVVPNGPVIEDKEDYAWYGMYMTTAEVNLYLAEFATYGASGLSSASTYFTKALTKSVEEYDRLAGLNKVPYYGTTYGYDPNEKPINLVNGEITTMLANPDYQLTGNKALDLEKIYLQQMLHFTFQPADQFVTGRRSGCPKFGSALIARDDYAANQMPAAYYPRRTSVSAPAPTDLMKDILTESYKYQGFSTTPGKGVLNTERVWQDVGAPQWGAGPIVK
ncbi:MAG: SusD/RagB family nutrient-binding outer membrane lipoprotein [Bacteroides sp.]